MRIATQPYNEQTARWPTEGRHILAQYDDESIIVYQAYRPSIGQFAAAHGYFGGEFSYSRMSWVKPNFLWMMYRSGWGTKDGQEVTLALRLRRTFFDAVLGRAVASTYDGQGYATRAAWQDAVGRSDVRLQWDPDHHPKGAPVTRRAIQLGLRGETLQAFGRCELLEVIDLSEFVASQRVHVDAANWHALVSPSERVYVPTDEAIGRRLGLSCLSDGVPEHPARPS